MTVIMDAPAVGVEHVVAGVLRQRVCVDLCGLLKVLGRELSVADHNVHESPYKSRTRNSVPQFTKIGENDG